MQHGSGELQRNGPRSRKDCCIARVDRVHAQRYGSEQVEVETSFCLCTAHFITERLARSVVSREESKIRNRCMGENKMG